MNLEKRINLLEWIIAGLIAIILWVGIIFFVNYKNDEQRKQDFYKYEYQYYNQNTEKAPDF